MAVTYYVIAPCRRSHPRKILGRIFASRVADPESYDSDDLWILPSLPGRMKGCITLPQSYVVADMAIYLIHAGTCTIFFFHVRNYASSGTSYLLLGSGVRVMLFFASRSASEVQRSNCRLFPLFRRSSLVERMIARYPRKSNLHTFVYHSMTHRYESHNVITWSRP